MSYFKQNQNVQSGLYAAVGSSTLTLSNFFVPGGATLAVTSLATHFHTNYAANTFLSNTTGFYPPGADTSLTYTPRAQIPAFSATLSANQAINSNSRGFYVVVIGAGGSGGGGRNQTAGTAVLGNYSLEYPANHTTNPQYANNITYDFTITVPATTTTVQIVFDPLTNTEANYDFFRLYSTAAARNAAVRTDGGVGSIYSNAGSSWPTVNLSIGTDIYGRFATDGSVTAYGFKFVATSYRAADDTGNGGGSGGTGAIVGYYFDFAANGANPLNAYYKYITGTGGTAGAIGTNANGGAGGNGGDSVFQLYNGVNTQIFSITAGGGGGGGGGTTGTTTAGTGGPISTTGTAAAISTDTINVRRNGANGGVNSGDTPGAGVTQIFDLQNSGGYSVVGTTGQSGSGGYGDGATFPSGSAGSAGTNGGIILFELF
jgi:hypothetical protein